MARRAGAAGTGTGGTTSSAASLPCPVVRYELDIDQPPERLLRRFASTAAQVGVTLQRRRRTVTHPGLERQDRSKSMIDKVSNWAEFSRDIFARGLERRAFGYPL